MTLSWALTTYSRCMQWSLLCMHACYLPTVWRPHNVHLKSRTVNESTFRKYPSSQELVLVHLTDIIIILFNYISKSNHTNSISHSTISPNTTCLQCRRSGCLSSDSRYQSLVNEPEMTWQCFLISVVDELWKVVVQRMLQIVGFKV